MSSIAAEMPQLPNPGVKLFDARAVTAATLFGAPAAGAALMAVNYSRLGEKGKAALTLATGIVVTALAVLLTWKLPNAASMPVALGLLFGTRQTAIALQGTAVQTHVDRGGPLGSRWGAFGVGLAFCAALFAIAFFAIYKGDPPGVKIGSHDEVFYSGSATKQDAWSLGDALKTNGYFKDFGADVFLDKGKDGTVVSFVVKDGLWNQPDTVSSFDEVGREIAPIVGGFPIRLRLVNAQRELKSESVIGKVDFPSNDDVYYFGSATETEARALGQSLTSQRFFQGRGSDVFLSRHGSGTAIAFVVGDAAFKDLSLISGFETVVRQAAPTVGEIGRASCRERV